MATLEFPSKFSLANGTSKLSAQNSKLYPILVYSVQHLSMFLFAEETYLFLFFTLLSWFMAWPTAICPQISLWNVFRQISWGWTLGQLSWPPVQRPGVLLLARIYYLAVQFLSGHPLPASRFSIWHPLPVADLLSGILYQLTDFLFGILCQLADFLSGILSKLADFLSGILCQQASLPASRLSILHPQQASRFSIWHPLPASRFSIWHLLQARRFSIWHPLPN